MKLMLLLLAVYALHPNPCRPPAPPPPASPIVIVDGHLYAVLHLEGWTSENASNAGGFHFSYSIDGMPNRLVHGGGHNWFGDDVTLPGMATTFEDHWPHPYFVADLALGGKPIDQPCPDTWCTYKLPTYYGEVLRLVPAPSLDAARAILAAIPRTGFPSGEVKHR